MDLLETQKAIKYLKDTFEKRLASKLKLVWCRKNHAELLFVNSESFGCEMPDGTLRHIYIDELLNLLQEEN